MKVIKYWINSANMKAARIQKNLTAEALGDLVNLKRKTIEDIENTRRKVSVPELGRIANVLQVDKKSLIVSNAENLVHKGKKRNIREPKKSMWSYSIEDIEDICLKLSKWADKDTSCHLGEFAGQYNRDRKWLYDLAEDHEDIARHLRSAREKINARYCLKGLSGEWNSGLVKTYAALTDPELKEWIRELNRNPDSKDTEIEVTRRKPSEFDD